MSASVEINDHEVIEAWKRLIATGRSPVQALREIGRYNVSATRLRFRNQAGPDGVKWKPSKRVEKHGGQTLRLHGFLRNSITSNVLGGGTAVEWGSSMKYAAAMNFGVDKQQKVAAHKRKVTYVYGRRLKKPTTANVKSFSRHMKIAARTFLGVNDADRAEMLSIMAEQLQNEVQR